MIRLAISDDTTALIALAEATGLFQPDQLNEVSAMLADYFASQDSSDRFWLTDAEENDGLLGIAYCELERMTEGTWNLQLIAIRPDRQGQGRGAALLRHVEQQLAADGGRILLVETSGLPEFDRTRAFYLKCGYGEEARIRDFYQAGEDKIVYRKVLAV
jgi:ribosomal protein S18 acetylase RimI-like enzyme